MATRSGTHSSSSSENSELSRTIATYGDLLFDLCESVLWNPASAQVAFRAIMKDVQKQRARNGFEQNERPWILRLAILRLKSSFGKLGRNLTPSEQIQLDSTASVAGRLKNFDAYFNRLPIEDRILLILKDKYALAYDEIASALSIPVGSLKVRRQQALRALEDWLWDNR